MFGGVAAAPATRVKVSNSGSHPNPLGFYATGHATVGREASQADAATAIQLRHRRRLQQRGQRAKAQPAGPQRPSLSPRASLQDKGAQEQLNVSDLSRQRSLAAAREALDAACAAQPIDTDQRRLKEALRQAEEYGVDASLVQAARDKLVTAERLQARLRMTRPGRGVRCQGLAGA